MSHRIYQYLVHIKTVNTEGEYQCVIMGYNNSVRVDRRKRYGAIYWLGFFMSSFRVDNIYLSLDRGSSQELFLLALRLILVVRWAGLDSDGVVIPTVILSAACPDSTPWSSSLIHLLRCLPLISFSTKNFRLRHLSVSCP